VRLEDDVIRLRPFTEDDVPAVVAACQDPEIPRWTRVPSPYTEADAREFLAIRSERAFAIADRITGELLGAIGAREEDEGRVEVGYWIAREARGRGVATRALQLLVAWSFEEVGAERVQLITDPANVASQRVAEKAGFQREGTLRSWIEIKGTRRDAVMYSLLPEDLTGPPRATTRFRA
jgi:RimJ/RimL family protein N-acetyltransferase